MKVQASVTTRCPNCRVVTRRKVAGKKGRGRVKKIVYVICTDPRHKQRQG